MKELTRQELDVYTSGDPGMVLAGGGWSGGGAGGFGSVGNGGFNLGLGSFDFGSIGSDIGGPAYTPTMAPNGLFGMSIAETLGVGTGILAIGGGLGQGIGASLAIEAAGGWGAIGGMGAAAGGLVGSVALGLLSAAAVGGGIGMLAYHNSELLRDGAQYVVGAVLTAIEDIGNAIVPIENWINSLPHHPVSGQIP
ncbi:hypothetical protein [Massilia sp. TWR1-2-2]|uniref:hypothetical protein n=1 Tax=Massilia sp. TWR1-2-2 TaxID=2804584 RepID=UPI003CF8A5F6